jgi:general secretion pathway protein A
MSQWKGSSPDNVRPTDVSVSDAVPSQNAAFGVLTYELYYGLKSKPFSLSTDPRSLYKSSSHAAVLEDLLAAIRRREGLIVLTGEMGTGKTTLCRAALYQLDRKTLTTFVPDPSLSREDLLRMLLVGFGEVSVHDLKQGRLKGTPRADLGCQLYEFLTSLESVDAFAALVIDEAQNLSAPLIDEIRALSEMEAGRRLLQIVLVGQPELRARLKLQEMQKISQRVTTACELGPLTREGVAGYVAHRLSVAGGTRDRVEFSHGALDLVFAMSAGIPRLVNRICDRALFHGHLDRTSQIGQVHVGRAVQELEIALPWQDRPAVAPPPATVAAPAVMSVGGLFAKSSSGETASSASDLKALLELPPVARQTRELSSSRAARPATSYRQAHRRRWWKRPLSVLSVPVLGMVVMLIAGGAAVSRVGGRAMTVEVPPLPASPSLFPSLLSRPASPRSLGGPTPAPVSARLAAVPEEIWVVQVAALGSSGRSVAMVRELTDQGWPAYRVEPDGTTQGLTLIHVGPFRSAADAGEARARLRAIPDYEGAFVRNIAK